MNDVSQEPTSEPETVDSTKILGVEKKGARKDFFVGLVIVVIVSAIVGVYVVFSSELIGDINGEAAASSAVNKKADKNSGNIWEELKAKGLQGEHYTLNLHGKKDTFTKQDCTVEPDPETGDYGNNVFIPSETDGTDNNQIIMTSGNSKGKWATEGNTTYGVRDACTAPFDGDAAELTIPPNEKGYYVTARVLGKPTDNPEIAIDGSLVFVGDELGNDMIVLGLVTSDGFETPDTTMTRTKGKVKAVDITGLFEWSGEVCYFDPTNYCYDDTETYMCSDINLCCADIDEDGVAESCTAPVLADDGVTETCLVDELSLGDMTTLGCLEYLNEWVFNIGDLVEYMWSLDASGNFKLANIRFYPVK